MPETSLLPSGGTVSGSQWEGRHRTAVVLLALHLPALLALGTARGLPLRHVLVELLGLGALLAVAARPGLSRRVRACAASTGLVGTSAVLVHVSGGATEAHIHFLLVLAVVAFYEEWVVLGLAVVVSLGHHVGLSLLAPDALFSAPAAQDRPFLYAGVHVAAVTAQCLLALVHWRVHERAVAEAAELAGRLAAQDAAAREGARREQQEALLAVAREEALAGVRAKAAFLANTGHEVRTPLNGVLGMTALLLAGELSDEQRERAELVRSSGEGLLAVVEQVLDLGSLEAGRLDVEAAPFALPELVAGCLAPLQAAAAAKGLDLVLDLAADLPERVVGDAARLRQVLLNLLGNAVKFTDSGTVRLSVDGAGRDAVWFAVSDSGAGIDEADQARLFEPFVQGDASPTRRQGGAGLGLAVSRELVARLGGELLVSSAPGDGAVFSFSLPLPLPAPRAEAPVAVPAPRDAAPDRPLRVLLAEDSAVNQVVAVGLLGALGLEVDVVDDGQQALDRLAADRGYDAVLLDCQMPVLDGYGAVRALRRREGEEQGVRLPVVALTASALPEDRDRCLAAGMDDYFSKPFDAQEVVGALQRLVPAR